MLEMFPLEKGFNKTICWNWAPYLKVQQVLRGSCPNGNMAMIGKYRRNVITLKENVRWKKWYKNVRQKSFPGIWFAGWSSLWSSQPYLLSQWRTQRCKKGKLNQRIIIEANFCRFLTKFWLDSYRFRNKVATLFPLSFALLVFQEFQICPKWEQWNGHV